MTESVNWLNWRPMPPPELLSAFLAAIWLCILTPPALAAPEEIKSEAVMSPPRLAHRMPEADEAPDAEPEQEPNDRLNVPPGGWRIGSVSILVGDIYDTSKPDENRKIFRLVNRLHRNTHDRVIRRQLLFESGDTYSPRLLEESERLLRQNRFLYDAEIVPGAAIDGRVDIEVRTRDVWTLTGGANFNRSGGENAVQFEIQDFNFLGTGKEFGISRTSDFERTSSQLLYRDFNIAGTRGRLEIMLDDTAEKSPAGDSDGFRRLLHLNRPFFALDTRWAAGLTVLTEDRVDRLFTVGQETSRFRHRINVYEAWWGRSPGLVGRAAQRWKLGFTYVGNRFDTAPDSTPPETLPPDRTVSYPWADFEVIQDRFIEARDLDKIARTEDLRLGRRFQVRLGWSSPSWGGDRDLAIFGSRAELGLKPGTGKLLLLAGNAGARWGSGGFETFVSGASARFFWRNFGNHLLFVEIGADLVEDLDPERQLTLGGDNGLRGYPLRFQEGNRRALLTVEQRFFTDFELFKLANIGAAAFVDVGRAWFAGTDDESDHGVLKDIGIGLRLSPSRSGRGTMVHLDVAFPLDGDGSIDSVQWLVTSKETF